MSNTLEPKNLNSKDPINADTCQNTCINNVNTGIDIDTNILKSDAEYQCFSERNIKEDKKQIILDAMIRCVRKHGFHAASMAEISKEAGISVGIIYRYFENKEAMIEAVIARDLEKRNEKFAEWENTPDDILFDTIISAFDKIIDFNCNKETAGVGLEIISEAARNERVAAMIAKAEEIDRRAGISLWRSIAPHLTDEELDAYNQLIITLFNGIMIHSIVSPNARTETLKHNFYKVLRQMLKLID